ncbi:CLUMA_CG013728, isoform A [Clunio marinus]|uniref:CLUMA_CG013728, isoform A n=1 Tax=Clunio marinus TaxID=568069 RepID=A0A1J1IL27_9DIPT|nr:CLUMA_CG013728, isoform A [Clunio marinus]
MSELKLTEIESAAKDYILNLMLNGLKPSQPCDNSFDDEDFALPKWYDEKLYKRGQRYFQNNRSGIMMSNLYGLFSLISEPSGAKLLDRTGMSSTSDTAKKRYVSTTLHMLSWYQVELKPGSKSWESMKRVRKMHLHASRSAERNKLGMISQCAMAMTKFGFMGYALVRPHLLGIQHDDKEDREAFVHLWAVIGYMLGIKDEFNMCLKPLEVVEIICRLFIRYAFIAFLQFDTPTFKKLGEAFIDGMKYFVPFSSFESRLFLARRLAGIPGYQYDVDMSKEFFHRQIFNKEEFKMLEENFQNVPGFEYRRKMVFNDKMNLLDVKRIDQKKNEHEKNEILLDNMDENQNIFGYYMRIDDANGNNIHDDVEPLLEIFDLKHPSELSITQVDENNIQLYLNDHKFKTLSSKDQWLVKAGINHVNMITNKFARPFYEAGFSVVLYLMEKYHGEQNK